MGDTIIVILLCVFLSLSGLGLIASFIMDDMEKKANELETESEEDHD